MSGHIDGRFSFRVVEEHIARRYPDPDHVRQECAATHGTPTAAPWCAIVLDVTRRRVLTWRARGVSFYDADEIAVRLGQHPSALWPDWWQADPDPRVDRDYMRTRRDDAYRESVRLRSVASAPSVAS